VTERNRDKVEKKRGKRGNGETERHGEEGEIGGERR
jgi:hypothetical protein